MAANPQFAERLAKAHGAHYAKGGDLLTREEIGVRVGKVLGPKVTISQQKVSTWFAGREPSYVELAALARVLEVSAGWLAFGEGTQSIGAPKPSETPIHTRVPIERFGPKYEPKDEAPRKRRPKAG